jgi:hypothetical protein
MPALRNWSAAQATVFDPEGKPDTRPHICPDPNSLVARLSFEKPTIVSRSARIVAPMNSGFAGSPGGRITGRGARSPTMTAGSLPKGGGSGRPNHGPPAADARPRPAPRPAGACPLPRAGPGACPWSAGACPRPAGACACPTTRHPAKAEPHGVRSNPAEAGSHNSTANSKALFTEFTRHLLL